jgi:hypothetical protein
VNDAGPAAQQERELAPRMRLGWFVLLAVAIVSLSIVRSAIATRLDSFTFDEAYHICSGVSYLRYGDFRLNPEHPPLVKLWVGTVISATGFHLGPLRQFTDKLDERHFSEQTVFRENDPDSVQRRARASMWMLNGLLLLALAFALERVFDAKVALAALVFLAIDPTVAAHLPVVMTDLPVALASAIAIVLATRAFRDWIWSDLAACSFFLGIALAIKHSAPVVLLSVLLIGAALAIFQSVRLSRNSRLSRFGKLAAVLAGALVVLWAFYLFHFSETRGGKDGFNRALPDKIADVRTPFYHSVLAAMVASRMVPRAYIWGFADTIRAGMEGRSDPQLFFGRVYQGNAPRYFFPAMLAVKLPLGLSVLGMFGLFLFLSGRLPPTWKFSGGIVLAAAVLFFVVLALGATYAGVRHALPVLVMLSIFGAFAGASAVSAVSWWQKILVTLCFLLAAVSALPVLRPWEYFNELVGGTAGSYRYFDDEGVDLGQRTKEIVRYYRQKLQPKGEVADIMYMNSDEEMRGRGVDYFGRDEQRDQARIELPERCGTIFISSRFLTRAGFWDRKALREATPATRFGNVFVYKGTYFLPGQAAAALYFRGEEKLYAEKPDEAEAERAFRRSVELDPTAFFVHIELANLYLKHSTREEALREYSSALQYAPDDTAVRSPIQQQIKRLENAESEAVPPLRNPFME